MNTVKATGLIPTTVVDAHGRLQRHDIRTPDDATLYAVAAHRNIVSVHVLLELGYKIHVAWAGSSLYLTTPTGGSIMLDWHNGLHFLPLAPVVVHEVAYADVADLAVSIVDTEVHLLSINELADSTMFNNLEDATPQPRAPTEVLQGLTQNKHPVRLAHNRTHMHHQGLYLPSAVGKAWH